MTNKSTAEDKLSALSSVYHELPVEAEPQLDYLGGILLKSWRKFVVTYFAAMIVGVSLVNLLYVPRFNVVSSVDVGSVAPGAFIPRSFHNTLAYRIRLEMVPALLEQGKLAYPNQELPAINVGWERETSLINLASRVPRGGADIAVSLHKQLVSRILQDLEQSYQVFNFELRNKLLSLRRQFIELDKSTAVGTYVEEERKFLSIKIANYENALGNSSARAIVVARVSEKPSGLSETAAYATVVVSSLFVALLIVFASNSIHRIKQRIADGG